MAGRRHGWPKIARVQKNRYPNCTYETLAPKKFKKIIFKETIEENKDRKPAIIVEEFNKKLAENNLEEEKIDIKSVESMAKEKNKINYR